MLFSERFACLRLRDRRCPSSSRGSSRSTRRTARARAAPAWARRWRSIRSCVVPDPDLSISAGALLPWANSAANYYEQLTEAIAETLRRRPRRAVAQAARGRARPVPLRHRRRAGEGHATATATAGRGRTRRDSRGSSRTWSGATSETDSEFSREKIEEYMSVRPCPECHGSRLRPESRSVLVSGTGDPRVHGAERQARADVGRRSRAVGDRPPHRAAHPARDRRAAAVPGRRRDRLPVDGPRRRDAVGRRGPADPAGDADRLGARGRPVRARRAVDRPAPAGQLEAHRDARAAARPRQHACSSSSTTSRRCGRPTTSSTSARAPGEHGGRIVAHGTAVGGRGGPGVAHRAVPVGEAVDRGAGEAAQADRLGRDRRRAAEQPEEHRRPVPARRR